MRRLVGIFAILQFYDHQRDRRETQNVDEDLAAAEILASLATRIDRQFGPAADSQ